ncbi:MAG: anhydro-N-acetylmuramic acid kinase [Alphaproteobacteria bacterium]|nr:anhydro-N-acetylmuramic acid kinase [Alphaproteobacteria bacterium]
MDTLHPQKVLGLISGSSLDGVNAAIITTDGFDIFDFGLISDIPYDDELREKLQFAHKNYQTIPNNEQKRLSNELTEFHTQIVKEIQSSDTSKIDLIGFHGHTIVHKPEEHFILDIGDGQMLANSTGIKTVSRFRQSDILSGGQGAPLSSVYHQALSVSLPKPVVFVDIGGISSLTWIGNNGEMLSFDIGPGNNIINDWVLKHSGQHMDYNGTLAALGNIHSEIVKQLLHHKFLAKHPPKAADKSTFTEKSEHLEGLNLNDGAATATQFIAEAIAYSIAFHLPEPPKLLVLCGGGALNPTLVRFIRRQLPEIEVKTSSDFNWHPQAIEAQAFAFLAARRINLIPSSYSFTTGVPNACICGEVFIPQI